MIIFLSYPKLRGKEETEKEDEEEQGRYRKWFRVNNHEFTAEKIFKIEYINDYLKYVDAASVNKLCNNGNLVDQTKCRMRNIDK